MCVMAMRNKLTIIASSYFPETCAPAKRLHALARALVAAGFDVCVIAPLPNYPQGRVYPGFHKRLIQSSCEDGVRVVRLLPIIVPKDRLVLRLIAEIISACLAALSYLTLGRASIVVASSPAIFLGPFGLLVAKLTGAKFVWDIRDLLWRYTQAVGETRLKRFAGDLIEALMVFTSRHAELLTATTESQQQYFVARGFDPAKTLLYPNGIDAKWFEILGRLQGAPRDRERFRIVYAGLIGYPQGLGTLISAAKLLAADPEIEIVLAGEGVERAHLEQRCRDEGIGNVRFVGYLPQDQLAELYMTASVLYAQLKGEPAFRSAQPSKVWEYLAAGRPVVYGGIGDAVAAVERSGGGITIPPDDPVALAEGIMRLRQDPAFAQSLAEHGRAFVAEHLRQENIVSRIVERLGILAGLSKEDSTCDSTLAKSI